MTKKLVTILAEELPEWPDGAKEIGQWPLGEIVVKSMIRCKTLFIATQMADDQDSCYVTRAQWEAERARILLESQPERDPVIKEIVENVSVGYRMEEAFYTDGESLWDKVAIAAIGGVVASRGFHEFPSFQGVPESAAIFGADVADAFMAERAKRMKG